MCKRSNDAALQIMIQVMMVLTSKLEIENRCSLAHRRTPEIYCTPTFKGWREAKK
jgi:hypothetical protein